MEMAGENMKNKEMSAAGGSPAKLEQKIRIGQDARSSGHFISFNNKKAYLFHCSCDFPLI